MQEGESSSRSRMEVRGLRIWASKREPARVSKWSFSEEFEVREERVAIWRRVAG